jgi:hypothetical protein
MQSTRIRTLVTGLTAIAMVLAAGCGGGGRGFRDADRARRLMELAAEEAGKVDQPLDRFTRQLNIAEMQIDRNLAATGRQTLTAARRTLEKNGAEFDEKLHIAGWVSLSELARQAGADAFAGSALDRAIELVRQVRPKWKRCQYVVGVAQELRWLRGKSASAEFLREAGPWAQAIGKKEDRREAYTAFSAQLFLCDDYDGGAAMIRRDDQPAWRSDTLAMLAREATPYKGGKWSSFGVPLDYKTNFQKQGVEGY